MWALATMTFAYSQLPKYDSWKAERIDYIHWWQKLYRGSFHSLVHWQTCPSKSGFGTSRLYCPQVSAPTIMPAAPAPAAKSAGLSEPLLHWSHLLSLLRALMKEEFHPWSWLWAPTWRCKHRFSSVNLLWPVITTDREVGTSSRTRKVLGITWAYSHFSELPMFWVFFHASHLCALRKSLKRTGTQAAR